MDEPKIVTLHGEDFEVSGPVSGPCRNAYFLIEVGNKCNVEPFYLDRANATALRDALSRALGET